MSIKQQVHDNYKNFSSVKTLASHLKCKPHTAAVYLAQLGIKLEGSGKKPCSMTNIFGDDSDSHYWIGYIAADGNVHKRTNVISIVSKDREHIKKVRSIMGDCIRLYKRATTSVVYISSKPSKAFLESIGITPCKSLTLELLCPINWAIFRGLFDGDGSVRYRKGNGCEVHITSASIKLMHQLQQFLQAESIRSSIRLKDRRSKNPCYGLYISQHDVDILYTKMYNDAKVFLERKEIIMRTYVEMRKQKSGEFRESPTPLG